MADLKQIMYGVTDFALMRAGNAYYVDRTDAPVTRLFITGVSPVTLDDVTSGFNIGANVSLDPALAELTGFTQADLREMLEYYRKNEFDFDVESVLRQMTDWYDHYVFSRGAKNDGTPAKSVASPILVLAYWSSSTAARSSCAKRFR